ncbi:hypothetical protein VME0621_02034 [Vibrio mediterranei]|jgi:hypothetical protein|nr:hypothetical protein VME0621_02034 [Vibrio mediterranei]
MSHSGENRVKKHVSVALLLCVYLGVLAYLSTFIS